MSTRGTSKRGEEARREYARRVGASDTIFRYHSADGGSARRVRSRGLEPGAGHVFFWSAVEQAVGVGPGTWPCGLSAIVPWQVLRRFERNGDIARVQCSPVDFGGTRTRSLDVPFSIGTIFAGNLDTHLRLRG